MAEVVDVIWLQTVLATQMSPWIRLASTCRSRIYVYLQ
jgi:hypothetical protein